MNRKLRRSAQLGAFTTAALLAVAGVAAAGTITTPGSNPFTVPGDASGNPQPFTIVATGYTAGAQVFAEICDGTPSTTAGWDPTLNCDLGTAPSPAIADNTGTVTFDGADPNFQIHPFNGPSPQGLFNCLAPGQADPNNGLTSFTNCQLRVSTNNTASTSDQAFRTLTLPPKTSGTTTTVPPTTTTTVPPTTTTTTVPPTTTTTTTTTPPTTTTTTVPPTTTTTTVPPTTTTTTTTVPPTTTTTTVTTTVPPALRCWNKPASIPMGGTTQLRGTGFAPGTVVKYALVPNQVLLGSRTANSKGAIDPHITLPSSVTPGHYLVRAEGQSVATGARAKCWATLDVQMSTGRLVAYVGGAGPSSSSSGLTGRLLGLALIPLGFGIAIGFPRHLRFRRP